VRGTARLDLAELRAKRLDAVAYGKLLGEGVLAEANVQAFFDQSIANAQTLGKDLRLRLFCDPALHNLHELRWETLRNPKDNSWLLTNESLLFSRFLSSSSWEQVHLRPKGALRALAIIANPQDLAEGKYQVENQTLAPVDVQGELARIQQGLVSIQVEALSSDPANPGQASLANLTQRLREGFDILYMACHGALLTKTLLAPIYGWRRRMAAPRLQRGLHWLSAYATCPPNSVPAW
jgi:hypothetical protein